MRAIEVKLSQGAKPGLGGLLPGVKVTPEIAALARSCGVTHPVLVAPEHIEVVSERYGSASLAEVFGYEPGWPLRSDTARRGLEGGLARAQ